MKLRVCGPNLLLLLLQVISLKNFHEIAGNALPEDASTSHTWVLGDRAVTAWVWEFRAVKSEEKKCPNMEYAQIEKNA